MKILTDLLERFSKSLNKDVVLKENIIKVIKDKTGVTPEIIQIKNGIAEISGSAVAKNEIKLKEEQILKELGSISKINYR